MAGFLFWSDAVPQKLFAIVAIALCAVGMLPHVRAQHLAPETMHQPISPLEDEPSLFAASGGLVADSDPAAIRSH